MRKMNYNLNGNVFTLSTPTYSLSVDTAAARADVILDGTAFVRLDLRSAVNSFDGEKTITDSEPDRPTFAGLDETDAGLELIWKGRSSLWEKEYRLICSPLRFRYRLTVGGEGRVDSVNYFSGDLSSPSHGSEYEFSKGFYPCAPWKNEDKYYFKPGEKNHRWNVLMIPPMFCYSFGCEGIGTQLALGLAARPGEHNFHSFDYIPHTDKWDTSFYLSTDQSGHTSVSGEWTAPEIIGYGARDEFDAMRKYSEYYFASGLARTSPSKLPPRFWQGPLACGWIGQIMRGYEENCSPTDFASEKFYEEYAASLKANELHPTAIIIDDKWQSLYAPAKVDTGKWPDMRGYIDRRHAEGIKTILWFKLWDAEGFEDSLCVVDDGGAKRIDPSNPVVIRRLRESIHYLLSPEGLDADGFKLDFAFFNPIGRGFTTYSGKYGTQLLYDYMELIYTAAKEAKPDALINCSPCHPYFAHLCDQARLHDYSYGERANLEVLETRARLFAIANPGKLIDTDNAGFNTRRDTMRWLMNQPEVGVPDLYSLTAYRDGVLTGEDIAAIAELWREYSERIDRMYD